MNQPFHTLYYLPSALSPNKLRMFIEYSHRFLEGKNSLLVICDGGLSSCYKNPMSNPTLCRVCKTNMQAFIKNNRIEERHKVISLPPVSPGTENLRFLFSNPSELKEITYDNFPIGQGVASAYVTANRDQLREFTDYEKAYLTQNLNDTVHLITSFRSILAQYDINTIALYNGRMFCSRPIVEIAKSSDLKLDIVENAGPKSRNLIVYENDLPHSISSFCQAVQQAWELEKKFEKKESFARHYFQDKEAGGGSYDKNYVKCVQSKLPIGFDHDKRNFALFTSSDDEIFAVGRDWGSSLIRTQLEGITLIADLTKDEGITIWVRIHPNLAPLGASAYQDILDLKKHYPHLMIVEPDSPASSYKLIQSVEKAITFGSTIGVEATYYGIPSLTLRAPAYARLDVVYAGESMTISELKAWLLDINTEPKKILGALMFGYFKSKGGIELSSTHSASNHSLYLPKVSITQRLRLKRAILFGSVRRFFNRFLSNKT